jgi:hypothetical protein
MSLDAAEALGGVRDSHRDQLLGLLRECSIGEHCPAERFERVVDLRR